MAKKRSGAGQDVPGSTVAPLAQTPVPQLERAAAWGAAIFVAALVLRLVYLFEMRRSDAFLFLLGDAEVYDAWAHRIAAGDWLGHEVFYQAPLYPYFLGVIYALGGSTFAVRVVQSILGSLACWLVFEAGRRLFSLRVGIVAGALVALYPTCLFFDGLMQKSALDFFFTSLLLLMLTLGLRQPGNFLWLATGAGLALLALTRENAMILIPILALWIPWFFRDACLSQRAGWVVSLLLGLGLVLLPVGIRNAVVGGEFHLTTSQFGTNLYLGNGPRATGRSSEVRAGRSRASVERSDAFELAEAAMQRPLSPSEVSEYWTRQTVDWIRQRPDVWLRLMGKKFLLLWNDSAVTDTEDQDTFAEESWVLSLLSVPLHFGVLMTLAAAGVWWSRGEARRLTLFYAIVLAFSASVCLFMIVERYRYPLVPLLSLFAAVGVCEAVTLAGRREWRSLVSVLPVVVAAVVVSRIPLIAAGSQRAPMHYNLGNSFAERGEIDRAADHFVKALQFDPTLALAWTNLGNVHAMRGNGHDAERCFREALRLQPDLAMAHANLAVLLNSHGQSVEAIEHLQEAVRLLPTSGDLRGKLGLVLLGERRYADAARQLEEAVRLEPKDRNAHYLLGEALVGQGNKSGAVTQLQLARDLAKQAQDAPLAADATALLAQLD